MAKKKQQDFAKVKLKVGRKLQPANVTSTEFKAKKVVLGPALVSDPIRSLTTCVSASTSVKLLHLSKLLDGPLLTSPHRITGDLLNALARLVLDSDDKVRRNARLCVEQSLSCLLKEQISLQNSITLLLTHVKCGLTHLNAAIANESRKLLSFLIPKSSPDHEQQFMQIIRARFWDGKSVSLSDLELAADIVHKFQNKGTQRCETAVIEWSSSNNHISWSQLHTPILSQSVDITITTAATGKDQVQDLLQLLAKIVADGLSEFSKRPGEQVTLSLDQGRRLVALLQLNQCLSSKASEKQHFPDYEVVGDMSKKKACFALTRQIKELIR